MNTQQAIYKMLTTSTGAHMLDSGGAYGRHWERNQARTIEDFQNEPESSMDEWGELTISLFHHLNRNLGKYDEAMDRRYLAFTEGSQDSHLEDIARFIEETGAREMMSDNSYNHDSALSQVIQWTAFELDGTSYIALQIHQGCDVRGGYTRPYIFQGYWEELCSEWGSVSCTGEETHHYDWSNGEWLFEDGSYDERFSPYHMKENARKVGITEYIPCAECGAPLEGTDTRKLANA